MTAHLGKGGLFLTVGGGNWPDDPAAPTALGAASGTAAPAGDPQAALVRDLGVFG